MKRTRTRPITPLIFGTAIIAAVLAAATLAVAQPPNDDCASATVIGALPFVDAIDTSLATNGVDDQVHSCTGALDANTVWYTWVAPANQTLDLDMFGTAYDSVVAVYDACGAAATEVACFYDDSGEDTRAPLSVRSGATLYIQVSDAGSGGGAMSLSIDDDAAWRVGSLKSMQRVAGSSSPSPSGPTIGSIGQSTMLSGRVAAYAATSEGLFQRTAGGLVPIVASGAATPIGGIFRTFGPPAIQNANSVAFWASIDGAGAVGEGIFSWNGAVIAPIVLEGDPTPAGGTYERFERAIAMNVVGDVAFGARISVAPDRALFVTVGGVPALVAREDDPAPCGGLFRNLADTRGGVALSDVGEVAFMATNDSNDEGVYHWVAGFVSSYACEGGAAPVLGGTYRRFGEHIDINVFGDAIFQAEVDNGSIVDAVYAGPIGGLSLIAAEGAAIAGTTINAIDPDVRATINDARQTAVLTRLSAAPGRAIVGRSSFVAPLAVVLAEGAACPLGGFVGNFGEEVDINVVGDVVIEVGCDGGRGVIRGSAGGGFGAVGDNNDVTALGAGWLFSQAQIDAASDVIVEARRTTVYGSVCGGGGCTPPLPTAMSPLAIPGAAGGNIESIDPYSLNGFREATFIAVLSGAARTEAILRGRPGGPIGAVVESGDPLPVAIGTFSSFSGGDPFDETFGQWRPASQGRKVAFAANVNSGAYTKGMFQARGATLATIAYDGMVAPNGAVLEDFSSPSIQGNRVAFAAETDIGDCIYLSPRPTLPLIPVVCVGDAAPASVGGTIDAILGPPTVWGRRVSFAATVAGGSETECIFGWDGATYDRLICAGEPMPGGGTVAGWDDPGIGVVPDSQGKGTVFGSEKTSGEGVVLAYRKDNFYRVAVDGFVTPAGATLGVYQQPATIVGKSVLFNVDVTGTADRSAVFAAKLK